MLKNGPICHEVLRMFFEIHATWVFLCGEKIIRQALRDNHCQIEQLYKFKGASRLLEIFEVFLLNI